MINRKPLEIFTMPEDFVDGNFTVVIYPTVKSNYHNWADVAGYEATGADGYSRFGHVNSTSGKRWMIYREHLLT